MAGEISVFELFRTCLLRLWSDFSVVLDDSDKVFDVDYAVSIDVGEWIVSPVSSVGSKAFDY